MSASALLTAAVQPGKQALKAADRQRVSETTASITDSLALDAELAVEQANAPRWDYLAGVRRTGHGAATCVIGIEVHPATPHEVKGVVKKQAAARQVLVREVGVDPVRHWYWIASKRVGISKTTSEYRLLLKQRIQLVGHLSVTGC